jgi:hypothetical protein
MSNIRVNTITDEVGTGAPDFPNGYTVAGAVPAAPESGVQTFTATGALANGDLVGLNPDGTVSVVKQYLGGSSDISPSDVYHVSSTFDTLNNKIVVTYRDSTTTYLMAVVGTVSGGTITFGTPVTAVSSVGYYITSVFDTLNNKVVVSYAGATGYLFSVVGTVSGTTISFGSPVTLSTGTSLFRLSSTFDSVNNKVAVSWIASSTNNPIYCRVGTVSGTTISFGAQATVSSASATYGYYTLESIFDSINGKVVIAFNNSGHKAIVGTVSGTSISFGTPVAIPGAANYASLLAYDAVSGAILSASQSSSLYLNLVVGTVSGTTISFGTPVTSSSFYWPNNSNYNSLTSWGNNLFTFAGFYNGNATTLTFRVVGSIISPESAYSIYLSSNFGYILINTNPINGDAVLLRPSTTSSVETAQVILSSNAPTPFVGIAAEAIADGASGKITVTGGINSGQTGLTTGLNYGYNTYTGVLTAGLTNVDLLAISPTQLYIK